MRRIARRPRRDRGGIAPIIGVVLLVGLTIVAGVILWSFRINPPPAPPTVSFSIRSGSSNPTWGDPTDCQPQGHWTYPLASSQYTTWANGWYNQCYVGTTGNFSLLNTSLWIVSSSSPASIPLSEIQLTFVCNNASSSGGTTVMLTGSLASMVWFPGVSTQPAPNAPHLGYCGNFDAGNWSGVAGLTPANGSLYNRLGMFVPLTPGVNVLDSGDMFILYLHNGGYPLTYLCVAAAVGLYAPWDCPSGDAAVPQLDYDDYHGAPPWCFVSENACTIDLTYTGTPQTILAQIPVMSLAPSPS
ncbi:MAG TPA: type IV pilin N-terminal domain-containing protein [Thermoplasmata archaeon]|nr:type IV pilin N-terminal domain-containing protein [Thermoplasmata archaeon]